MPPISEARRRANEKYNKKAYETILLRVKKGQKEVIRSHAIEAKESINEYIVRALAERMERQERDR